jgi:dihydroxyacetone kinase phosphoprotein-dependent L subunit
MSEAVLDDARLLVRTVADTVLENEKYFSDLDAVVGDGDFGYSLARGFGKLVEDWDSLEYDDVSGLLKRTAVVLSSRIGGTSGPIWGTAFLRASTALKDVASPGPGDAVAALRAAVDGIKQRGNADLGDKTLLDALIPATDRLEQEFDGGASVPDALAAAAATARESAEATKTMLAKRGRASYAGERSQDSVDAGAMAVAVLFERVSSVWSPTSQAGGAT